MHLRLLSHNPLISIQSITRSFHVCLVVIVITMMIALSFIFAFSACTIFIFYKYLLFPLCISPLSKIPSAHFSCALSPLWILWQRFKEEETHVIYAAHQKHGPIVRLGPSEVSVNCVDGGLRTVYAGNFEKPVWYKAFSNYGSLSYCRLAERTLTL